MCSEKKRERHGATNDLFYVQIFFSHQKHEEGVVSIIHRLSDKDKSPLKQEPVHGFPVLEN